MWGTLDSLFPFHYPLVTALSWLPGIDQEPSTPFWLGTHRNNGSFAVRLFPYLVDKVNSPSSQNLLHSLG